MKTARWVPSPGNIKAGVLATLLLVLGHKNPMAQLSSGGNETLARGVIDGGGQVGMTGGNMTLNGSLSPAFFPANGQAPLRGGAEEVRDGYYGFSTLYSHLILNVIPLPNNSLLTLQPGSLPDDFDIQFQFNPRSNPITVNPSIIQQADQSAVTTWGASANPIANTTLELVATDKGGRIITGPLNPPGQISLGYQDSNGIINGVRASTLQTYVLDQNHGLWVRVPDAQTNAASKQVNAPLNQMGVMTLIGAADTNVSQTYAYPVPWDPFSGNPARGTEACGITFTNLPSAGTIHIYTIAGQRVRSLAIPSSLPQCSCPCVGNQLSWDVRADNGGKVASGVYIWRIESDSNSKTGKLMVIR